VTGLLAGVRVLESAMPFNGDRLGCLLGALGADVVKIESPFQGDYYLRDFLGQITPHHSPAHLEVNKHKRRPAPDLGQHTDEVLAEVGLSPAEIADLRSDGVL
jgi:crotonobetainyl-CoA:carnitine CoA-transferase CaiB-like acyl-CoA transferase